MAGGEMSTPVNATYAHSSHIEDATHSTVEIPDKENYLGALKGGLGYDIPLNAGKNPLRIDFTFADGKTSSREITVTKSGRILPPLVTPVQALSIT